MGYFGFPSQILTIFLRSRSAFTVIVGMARQKTTIRERVRLEHIDVPGILHPPSRFDVICLGTRQRIVFRKRDERRKSCLVRDIKAIVSLKL